MSGVRFSPGNIYVTPGALEAVEASEDDLLAFIIRHISGDWGVVDDEDKQTNEDALRVGNRLLSAYLLSDGQKIWVITERDRSSTTALLPSEY